MTVGAEITSQALDVGLVLSRCGERLLVQSPLGHPLPDELHTRLLEHKAQILDWLDYCEAADELLLACTERLVRDYPTGLPLDAPLWRAAEEKLHRAHHSQDIEVFRGALDAYESFAKAQFQRSQHKEQQ